MDRSGHTFKIPARRCDGSLYGAQLCRFLCLLFVASVVACGTSWAQSAPASSAILPFAVADLDGDLRPDLVNIQTGQSGASVTDYWIQLQLSAIGRQSILVVAPSGGLQISARDINGDNAPDLVLTTTWLKKPVAIFLNDGHGGFSRVDPRSYPEAFGESESHWGCAGQQSLDAVVIPQKSRDGIGPPPVRVPHLGSLVGFAARSNCGTVLHPFRFSYQGRAPPLKIPQL